MGHGGVIIDSSVGAEGVRWRKMKIRTGGRARRKSKTAEAEVGGA